MSEANIPSLKNDLLLKAAWQQPVSRTPVWMMRQAGRTDPQYQALKKQDGRPLEELFADPETAIEFSLLPKRFGVDAIIFYQDILTPLTPMGAPFVFRKGPILEKPIQTLADVQALKPIDPASQLPFVGQTLRGLTRELNGDLPLLGFAGAPMTLAFFLIAGKSPMKQPEVVQSFIKEQPDVLKALLPKLVDMTIDYLKYQIENGVHAVQLFESLAHTYDRSFYEEWVLPTHQQIMEGLPDTTPKILFARECSYVDLMLQTKANILSVGSCVNLKELREQANRPITIQGNVSNELLRTGTPEQITQAVKQCLEEAGPVGHILNLNHGLLPDTPFENVQHFVKIAKELGTHSAQ